MSSAHSSPTKPTFLVVEDDRVLARAVGRELRRRGNVSIAHNCAESKALIGSTDLVSLTGLVVDMMLPDGPGSDILRLAHRRFPGASALVLTASDDREYASLAFDLDAWYLRKPAGVARLGAFAEAAIARSSAGRERIDAAISRAAIRYELSPRQAQMLRQAVDGASHQQLASALGISVQTSRNAVSEILRQAGADSLQALLIEILTSVP